MLKIQFSLWLVQSSSSGMSHKLMINTSSSYSGDSDTPKNISDLCTDSCQLAIFFIDANVAQIRQFVSGFLASLYSFSCWGVEIWSSSLPNWIAQPEYQKDMLCCLCFFALGTLSLFSQPSSMISITYELDSQNISVKSRDIIK